MLKQLMKIILDAILGGTLIHSAANAQVKPKLITKDHYEDNKLVGHFRVYVMINEII